MRREIKREFTKISRIGQAGIGAQTPLQRNIIQILINERMHKGCFPRETLTRAGRPTLRYAGGQRRNG